MESTLRILYLEEDEQHAEKVAARLAGEGMTNGVVRAGNRVEFVAALEGGEFDLILADYQLPSFDGISALEVAREKCPQVPFIVVSGRIGEETAIKALKAGASDYVSTDNLHRLVPSIRQALREAAEQKRRGKEERKRMEDDLRLGEERFGTNTDITDLKQARAEIERLATFPQMNPSPVIELDMTGRITFCNKATLDFLRRLGSSDASVFIPPDLPDILVSVQETPSYKCSREITIQGMTFQESIYFAAQFQVIRIYATDVTVLKRTQETLRQTNDELERRVAERIKDLARTIDTLQGEITERERTEAALRKSEERYVLAVAGANYGIWDVDFETGNAYFSPRWKSMLGYGEDEIRDIVEAWKSLIHPDDYARAVAFLDDYLAGRVPEYQLEYRLRHKDGSYRWIVTRGACSRDATGKPCRMVGSHTDITERIRSEETILRLNRLYAVLSETNQAIVRASDRDSLFRDICRIVVSHGGFRMAWIGLVDEESGMIKPAAWSDSCDGYLSNCRITVRQEPEGLGPTGSAVRDGSYYICNDFVNDARTAPWHEKAEEYGIRSSAAIALKLHGKVIGALTIYASEKDFFRWQLAELLHQMALDISFALENLDREARRREAEKALQEETAERLRALEALREKDQMLMQQSRLAAMGEMLGNIAHQWRQPLNTLGLIVQELPMTYKLGEFSEEYLEGRVNSAKQIIFHMSQTIDDFRNFFSPDKESVPFKVNQVVTKTVSLIEGSFSSLRIKVKVDAAGDPVINGCANEYSQVILNILINARDVFLERRVEHPAVTIKTRTEGGKAVVTITDNAGGVPIDIIDRIFDPYFTTKGPDKGTGVGLFMSKTIIEKSMKGRLTVRNSGNGAEFRIEV